MPPSPLNPYAVSKLFCEEAGRAFWPRPAFPSVAFLIGNILPGENVPHAGMGIGLWGQQMWLSNRGFPGWHSGGDQRARRAVRDPESGIQQSRNALGPVADTADSGFLAAGRLYFHRLAGGCCQDAAARLARLVPGQWLRPEIPTVARLSSHRGLKAESQAELNEFYADRNWFPLPGKQHVLAATDDARVVRSSLPVARRGYVFQASGRSNRDSRLPVRPGARRYRGDPAPRYQCSCRRRRNARHFRTAHGRHGGPTRSGPARSTRYCSRFTAPWP